MHAGYPLPDRVHQQTVHAATVLLLAEEHRLHLGNPLTRWISDCPGSWRSMTLHHLLSHTSGIGHWFDYPEIELRQPVEPEALLSAF